MKTDTPSLETPQAARLRRRQLIRQLLERDKTPLAILFMAAVVGTLVGLAAVAFDKGVARLQNQRMGALVHTADNYPLLLTVAFLCSAVLAMFGYFWCANTRRKQVVRGSRKLKGAGRSTSRSLVACVAGEILWRAGDTRRRHGARARRTNRADRRQYRSHGA